MEEQLSEVLDNLLGLLLLEGSYEIEETEESVNVLIETKDAGRLIGFRGDSLEALQLIVNQMIFRKMGFSAKGELAPNQKRVILDVEGWRKQKEEDLRQRAKEWANQVLETGKELELEPLPAWQRRIVHMVAGETEGLSTESIGEGRDRHIVIKLKTQMASKDETTSGSTNVESKEPEVKSEED
ncbi:MAG: KH domain-containing protein [Patescibacteria group bacterium]|nr:KH domain-containing protein [Patescibacteria group bacterium]